MKKASHLRTLLGISQQDMALLLQVHRSQYSMFELGLRDLPRPAKLLVAQILDYAKTDTLAKSDDHAKSNFQQLYLTELLRENELKRFRLDKKLSALRGTNEKQRTVLRVTGFLTQNAKGHSAELDPVVACIQSKAARAYKKCDDCLVVQHEIRLELLELERKYLEELLAYRKVDTL